MDWRITNEERKEAEKTIFRAIQEGHFGSEMKELREKKADDADSRVQLNSSKSTLTPLSPFIGIDGLIRVGSRIIHAPVDEDVKTPIVLPRKDETVRSFVEAIHKRNLHAGAKHTLTTLFGSLRVYHFFPVLKLKS